MHLLICFIWNSLKKKSTWSLVILNRFDFCWSTCFNVTVHYKCNFISIISKYFECMWVEETWNDSCSNEKINNTTQLNKSFSLIFWERSELHITFFCTKDQLQAKYKCFSSFTAYAGDWMVWIVINVMN